MVHLVKSELAASMQYNLVVFSRTFIDGVIFFFEEQLGSNVKNNSVC